MKKKPVNIIVCLLASFLVSACTSNVQTVEGTRMVSQTLNVTETPLLKSTQKSPTLTDQQVSDTIAACYQVGSGCSACEPKMNNSVLHVVATTRMFINVPKDLYPEELFRYATTISGQETMGYISNGGLPGVAFAGSPECWSTYVEFDGGGEVDLRIPAIVVGVPDYFVRFIVDGL